jgi:hypothetical protein
LEKSEGPEHKNVFLLKEEFEEVKKTTSAEKPYKSTVKVLKSLAEA